MNLRQCQIRYNSGAAQWEFLERVGRKWVVGIAHIRKTMLMPLAISNIKNVIAYVQSARSLEGAYGFSLRIYKKNGQLQEERTYPRSRDPKCSKG